MPIPAYLRSLPVPPYMTPHRCSVQADKGTAAGSSPAPNWVLQDLEVPCLVSDVDAAEADDFKRRGIEVSHKIVFPPWPKPGGRLPVVGKKNRIVMTKDASGSPPVRPDGKPRTFEVQGVVNPSGLNAALVAYVLERVLS